jgi:hypothetical protein
LKANYEVVTDHAENDVRLSKTAPSARLASFAELSNALKGFIDSGANTGVIKAVD